MITFNELLERAKSELIAIHTPTEKQAKTLLKALDEKGYIWINGVELTTETRYGNYKENTCYDFTFDFRRILNKKVCVSHLVWYPKHGYTIIEFTDIDFAKAKITFNELLERAKAKNIVVHTPTEEQAITLLKELAKNGYTWCGGDKLTTTHYGSHKENTCYDFSFDTDGILVFKKVMFGALIFYQDQGYTIIEFENIDFAEKPIKTTLKSDIKVIYQSKDKLTTCVVFEDSTKVKVKKHKGDKGSIYTAVAYAITKKTYGSNKVFTEIVDEKLYKGRK